MDVSQFTPNELTVKTVDSEDEHGFTERYFIRKFLLPKGFDFKNVVSTISPGGVQTIKAPPPRNKTKKQK